MQPAEQVDQHAEVKLCEIFSRYFTRAGSYRVEVYRDVDGVQYDIYLRYSDSLVRVIQRESREESLELQPLIPHANKRYQFYYDRPGSIHGLMIVSEESARKLRGVAANILCASEVPAEITFLRFRPYESSLHIQLGVYTDYTQEWVVITQATTYTQEYVALARDIIGLGNIAETRMCD